MKQLEDVLTATEAAALWGLSRNSLQAMANRGDFGPSARKAAGTWLFLRSALVERYGEPRGDASQNGGGIPVADLLGAYSLSRVGDVLGRREDFGPGELWREGRRWYTTRQAMESVFGGQASYLEGA